MGQRGDNMGQRGDTMGQRGDTMGLRGDTTGQDETTAAAERLFGALELFLNTAKLSLRSARSALDQRILKSNADLSESENVSSRTYPTISAQVGASDAAQCLLATLDELLERALDFVPTSRRRILVQLVCDLPDPKVMRETVERLLRYLSKLSAEAEEALGEYSETLWQKGVTAGQVNASVTVERLMKDVSESSTEAEESFEEDHLTPGQRGDLAGRGEDTAGQSGAPKIQGDTPETVQRLSRGLSERWTEAQESFKENHVTPGQRADPKFQGDTSETVQRLVAGVKRVMTAADLYLQAQNTATEGVTSEASQRLLMSLTRLVWDAQGSVLTFHNVSVDPRELPGAARCLLRDLAKLLKEAASLVRSYREKKRRVRGPKGRDCTPLQPLLQRPEDLQLPEGRQRDPELTSLSSSLWRTVGQKVWDGRTKYLVLVVVLLLVTAGLIAGIAVLYVASAATTGKDVKVLPPCDKDWIWYRNKCFYFSETEGSWTEAKGSCAALNSTLAMIDTQQELSFMLRHKGDYNHWIGLRRDSKTQPWTWVSGTKFNNWFTISDTSECAYLSYGKVKSLECHITNQWICTKVTL